MDRALGLDRQVPEWLGAVSERVRAPANAIVATLAMAVIFDGKLNLVASAWFTVLASSLSWIMPGINAVIAGRTRPDLVQNAPWRRWLPLIGLIWLAFAVALYWFAGLGPIVNTLTNPDTKDALAYLNGSGVTFVAIVLVVGVVWYVIQAVRNRSRGIQTHLMYQMLPPD